MVVILVAIQAVALVCGALAARFMFPDSKQKRSLVMTLAGLTGIFAGAAFVIITMKAKRGV